MRFTVMCFNIDVLPIESWKYIRLTPVRPLESVVHKSDHDKGNEIVPNSHG